ncbi:hypothetical protein Tco_0438740 [Tanacetum coccineum]
MFYDTGINPNQAMQYPNVKECVDLGTDGKTLYYCSPVSTQIAGNLEVELRAGIFEIFRTDVQITYNEDISTKGILSFVQANLRGLNPPPHRFESGKALPFEEIGVATSELFAPSRNQTWDLTHFSVILASPFTTRPHLGG